jgi:hypothetical protein
MPSECRPEWVTGKICKKKMATRFTTPRRAAKTKSKEPYTERCSSVANHDELEAVEMQPYELALATIDPKELSLGYHAIHVYQPNELASGQIGYSVSPTGKKLVGDGDGDWQKSWLLIGYDESGGDPLFIDTSEEEYPVYTTIVGQGRWDRTRVADSLAAFGHALSAVAEVAEGREYPVALEQNPLSKDERDNVLASIRQHNPKVNMSFWEMILDS